MPKSLGVKYPERCYEVHTTRMAWTADEINYGRKFWGRKDERKVVPEMWRAKEREEPIGKHEVIKRADKEKKAEGAVVRGSAESDELEAKTQETHHPHPMRPQ